jgi:peptidylprolyl isomerase
MTKAERRAAGKAAKLAARRAAEAKRRRRALAGTLAGLAVVGVVIAVFVLFAGSDDDSGDTAAPQGSAPASASAAASPPADPAFPPLPEGADPALGTKPAVGKGSGDLTKLTGTTLVAGNGPATRAGQTITVNYVGVSYRTGEEFDASWNQQKPFSFQLGSGGVIPGWDRGLVGVKVGSRVQLDIPADLAYGENPAGGEPAGPLRFVVDVLAAQ